MIHFDFGDSLSQFLTAFSDFLNSLLNTVFLQLADLFRNLTPTS